MFLEWTGNRGRSTPQETGGDAWCMQQLPAARQKAPYMPAAWSRKLGAVQHLLQGDIGNRGQKLQGSVVVSGPWASRHATCCMVHAEVMGVTIPDSAQVAAPTLLHMLQ
jgi:hypothetical protein